MVVFSKITSLNKKIKSMKNFLITNDNLIKAMEFAKQIAKQTGGRIATSPDIALLRTHQDLETLTWNCWAIPATTLYIGIHKDKRLIVVANHFGPLNTEERWKKWEASGEKDEGSDREKYGTKGCPKITQEEFDSLVDGKYGEVKVIDFDRHYSLYKKTSRR
jgi:hypothetical protein